MILTVRWPLRPFQLYYRIRFKRTNNFRVLSICEVKSCPTIVFWGHCRNKGRTTAVAHVRDKVSQSPQSPLVAQSWNTNLNVKKVGKIVALKDDQKNQPQLAKIIKIS